ncbi:MAG: ComF family protein [Coxiellaceae bacterium]|nr:ComF family protein [Coxiellaceae bacterium]
MKIYSKLFKAFCPIQCILCDLTAENDQQICEDCYQTLPITENRCKQCGIPTQLDNSVCGACLMTPPHFDCTHILFNYEKPMTQLITHYKFYEKLSLSDFFATQWIGFFKKNTLELPNVIIPIPLHNKRLQKRGFNQALEIAKPVGKYFQIPVDAKSCVRIKNTEAQLALSAEKRQHNIKNAFALSKKIVATHAAIFDDVMTTGSTVGELSRVLKKTGVQKISVFCCARV